ncbi:ATP-dependent nuclease [Halanaerobium salsuginis]|uniref:Predicted ATP-dependent endonuclease of the OLD family, contains P-loop ATPase and TOPRIM domains n=1 Tax=Halanaerobium salsuginis TaxID=29563 RepID=A0A1I4K831_9FIRM|nr:AAA family ATPase [Halanaerobium salsuginis]SFL74945.1 Predicted ATP-dependent endonuclease of the OLD family, contains P-loop ATPase and TOPRIM domains [Halanaerobium salsuginis]
MYVKHLKINNYRGIKSGEFDFKPGLNILIGKNNIGKTTILNAIDMVLNPYIQWWKRDYLNEFDFWQGEIKNNIEIELVLGCNNFPCDKSCCFFQSENDGEIEICKLAEYAIIVDNDGNNTKDYINIDNIEQVSNPENVVRLFLTATYNSEDGYVEVEQNILNELGEQIKPLTRSIKEWIGCTFLSYRRNIDREMRLQKYSLLTRALGNLDIWKKELIDEFKQSISPKTKELTSTDLGSEIIESINRLTKDLQLNNGSINIGVGDINKNDIFRQIELGQLNKVEENEWFLPFSRQGRGMQNITSIILSISNEKEKTNERNILLLEEVEQNLEPQLQRNIINITKRISQENTQFIFTTHSPYVLSPLLNLEGVQRIYVEDDKNLYGKSLESVMYKKKDFILLRKKVTHDLELLEALFSRLVIIWEGDSEAGLYNTFMRNNPDYPAEWLSGINGGDGGKDLLPYWFKKAGYNILVVLDGDEVDPLVDLKENDIPFIALSDGKALESIIEEGLLKLDKEKRANILLSCIGITGEISPKKSLKKYWPQILGLFPKHPKGYPDKGDTEEIIKAYKELDSNSVPEDLIKFIKDYKGRRVYEAIALEFINNNIIPETVITILNGLKEIWEDNKGLGQYQLNNEGTLVPWCE